jgi:hypothetical protein
MNTYRMEQTATVCFDVQAESEEEAIKKAERAATDFSFGFELPDGQGYSAAALYTSEEESADVVDVTEQDETLCTCANRSWYGEEHDSACELQGKR